MITADKFLEAWRTVWNRDGVASQFVERWIGKYWSSVTDYMLKDDEAFLRKVGYELGIGVEKNGKKSGHISQDSDGMFKLDMTLVSKWGDGYPTFIDVMIEHENIAKNVIDEVWKLMFLRSPLKVIVTYASDPITQCQLDKVWCMLDESICCFPENQETEYLFIIGQLVDNESFEWRWLSQKEKSPQHLC